MRLMAHELTHVAQQLRGPGASSDAESRARNAAARVARGGFVAPEMIGQASLGVYADDGIADRLGRIRQLIVQAEWRCAYGDAQSRLLADSGTYQAGPTQSTDAAVEPTWPDPG